jgi:hypothetical protein
MIKTSWQTEIRQKKYLSGTRSNLLSSERISRNRDLKVEVAFFVFVSVMISAATAILVSCNASFTVPESTHKANKWVHLSSEYGNISKPSLSTQQTASLILDVDKNGINDFIIGTRQHGPSVLWYRRVAAGWAKYTVEKDTLPIEAGGTFYDIDRDGDLDIVFGADASDNKMWWWENPYPNYHPDNTWVRREIKNSGANKHHDQIFGDFDGDGGSELVFWNQKANKLFIADIPLDSKKTQPWNYTAIFSAASESEGLAKADLDGDGKVDLVGGGRWFKHKSGTNYIPHIIDDSQRFTRAAVGQLKKGGWAEVVFVVGDGKGRLKWYEWTGNTWVGHDLLGFDVDHGHSLAIADINRDGNLDIFCAEMRLLSGKRNRLLNKLFGYWPHSDASARLFLGDGHGNFVLEEVTTGFGNHESKVADLDGDGDLDILSKPYNWKTPRLDIWLNTSNWQRHVIDPDKPWRSIFISSADIDGDDHIDIITGGWWYKNPGNSAGPWQRHTIGAPLNNMAVVDDFDSDGDMDVLGTEGQSSKPNASLVWARNDGSGSFTIISNISKGDGDFLQGVAVGQFQEATRQVALSWHTQGKGIQMLTIPSNPGKVAWPWRRISPISQDEALSAGDIDGDGDLDLLLGTMWLQNNGTSWRAHALSDTLDNPDRNRLADVNGDGRLDAIVGFEAISKQGKLAWYEQPSSSATGKWDEHIIAQLIGPMSLDVGDIDTDGDLDLVVGEHNLSAPTQAKLFVFENRDGHGASWAGHLVYRGDEHHDGAQLADIDSDGDLDIISIGWKHSRVLFYENRTTPTTN